MAKEKKSLFRSAEEKRDLINSYKNSKHSLSGFCEANGLAPSTLSTWLAKEKNASAPKDSPNGTAGFIRLDTRVPGVSVKKSKEKSHLSLKITLGRLLVLTYERV